MFLVPYPLPLRIFRFLSSNVGCALSSISMCFFVASLEGYGFYSPYYATFVLSSDSVAFPIIFSMYTVCGIQQPNHDNPLLLTTILACRCELVTYNLNSGKSARRLGHPHIPLKDCAIYSGENTPRLCDRPISQLNRPRLEMLHDDDLDEIELKYHPPTSFVIRYRMPTTTQGTPPSRQLMILTIVCPSPHS